MLRAGVLDEDLCRIILRRFTDFMSENQNASDNLLRKEDYGASAGRWRAGGTFLTAAPPAHQ